MKKEEKELKKNENNFWVDGYNKDISKFVENKNGFDYLTHGKAWDLAKREFGDDFEVEVLTSTEMENEEERNIPYFIDKDGGYAFVCVKATLKGYGDNGNDLEQIEWLPIDDYKFQSIPLEKITEKDVYDTQQRCITKAIGTLTGIGYSLYTQIKTKIEPVKTDWSKVNDKYLFSYIADLNLFSKDEKNINYMNGKEYANVEKVIMNLKRIMPRSSFGTLWNDIDDGRTLSPYKKTLNGNLRTRAFLRLVYPSKDTDTKNTTNGSDKVKYYEDDRPPYRMGMKSISLNDKGVDFGREIHKSLQRTITKLIAKETGIAWNIYCREFDAMITKEIPKVGKEKVEEKGIDFIKKQYECLCRIVNKEESGIKVLNYKEIATLKRKSEEELTQDDIKGQMNSLIKVATLKGITPNKENTKDEDLSIARSVWKLFKENAPVINSKSDEKDKVEEKGIER